MHLEMEDSVFQSHKSRAQELGSDLLTVQKVSRQIWDLTPESTLQLNGKILELGAIY